MKWNNEESYVRYNTALGSVKRLLGLGAVDFYTDSSKLTPYITYILEYLSKKLILLGSEPELKDLVQKVLDIYKTGSELIIDLKSIDLAEELGIDVEEGEVDFEIERFVFSWTNVMTDLVVRIKFQYSFLFATTYDGECCTCGTKGETTTNYEAWRSGIYPEDELYDRSVLYQRNTSWGTLKPKDVDCGCLRN